MNNETGAATRRDSLGLRSSSNDFTAEADKTLGPKTGIDKNYHIPKKGTHKPQHGVMHTTNPTFMHTTVDEHSTSTMSSATPHHKSSLAAFKEQVHQLAQPAAGRGNFFGTERTQFSNDNKMAGSAIGRGRADTSAGSSNASSGRSAHLASFDDRYSTGNNHSSVAGDAARSTKKISFYPTPTVEYGKTGSSVAFSSSSSVAANALAGRPGAGDLYSHDPKLTAVPLARSAIQRPNSDLVSGVYGRMRGNDASQQHRKVHEHYEDPNDIVEFDTVPGNRALQNAGSFASAAGSRSTNNSRSAALDPVQQEIIETRNRRRRPDENNQSKTGFLLGTVSKLGNAFSKIVTGNPGVAASAFYATSSNQTAAAANKAASAAAAESASLDDSDIMTDNEPSSSEIAAKIRASTNAGNSRAEKQPVIDFIELDEDDEAVDDAEFAASLAKKCFNKYDGPSSIAGTGLDCEDWCRNNPWFQSMFSMVQCEPGWHCYYVPKYEADHQPMKIEARNVLCLMPPNYTPESTLDFAACYINDHFSMDDQSGEVPLIDENKTAEQKAAVSAAKQPQNFAGESTSGENSNSGYKSANEAGGSGVNSSSFMVSDEKEDSQTSTAAIEGADLFDGMNEEIPPSDAEDSDIVQLSRKTAPDDAVDNAADDGDGFEKPGDLSSKVVADADDARSQASSTNTIVSMPVARKVVQSNESDGDDDEIICESVISHQHPSTSNNTSMYFPDDGKMPQNLGTITERNKSVELVRDKSLVSVGELLPQHADIVNKSASGGRSMATGYAVSSGNHPQKPIHATRNSIRTHRKADDNDEEWNQVRKPPSPVKQQSTAALNKTPSVEITEQQQQIKSKSILPAYDDIGDSDGSPAIVPNPRILIIMSPPKPCTETAAVVPPVTTTVLPAVATSVASSASITNNSAFASTFQATTPQRDIRAFSEAPQHVGAKPSQLTPISGAHVDSVPKQPHHQQPTQASFGRHRSGGDSQFLYSQQLPTANFGRDAAIHTHSGDFAFGDSARFPPPVYPSSAQTLNQNAGAGRGGLPQPMLQDHHQQHQQEWQQMGQYHSSTPQRPRCAYPSDAFGPPGSSSHQQQQQHQYAQIPPQKLSQYDHNRLESHHAIRQLAQQHCVAAAPDDDVKLVMQCGPVATGSHQYQRTPMERTTSSSMMPSNTTPESSPRKPIISSPHNTHPAPTGPPRVSSSVNLLKGMSPLGRSENRPPRAEAPPPIPERKSKSGRRHQSFDEHGRKLHKQTLMPQQAAGSTNYHAATGTQHIAGASQRHYPTDLQSLVNYQEQSGGGSGKHHKKSGGGGGRKTVLKPSGAVALSLKRELRSKTVNKSDMNQPKISQFVTNNKHSTNDDDIQEEVHASDDEDAVAGDEGNVDIQKGRRSQSVQPRESVSEAQQDSTNSSRNRRASGNHQSCTSEAKDKPEFSTPARTRAFTAVEEQRETPSAHAAKSRNCSAGMTTRNRDASNAEEKTTAEPMLTPQSRKSRRNSNDMPSNITSITPRNHGKMPNVSQSSSAGSTKPLMQTRRRAAVQQQVSVEVVDDDDVSSTTAIVGANVDDDADGIAEGDVEAGANTYNLLQVVSNCSGIQTVIDVSVSNVTESKEKSKPLSQEELVDTSSTAAVNSSISIQLSQSQGVQSSLSSSDATQSSTKAVLNFPIDDKPREVPKLGNVSHGILGTSSGGAGHSTDRKRANTENLSDDGSAIPSKKPRVDHEVIDVSSDEEPEHLREKKKPSASTANAANMPVPRALEAEELETRQKNGNLTANTSAAVESSLNESERKEAQMSHEVSVADLVPAAMVEPIGGGFVSSDAARATAQSRSEVAADNGRNDSETNVLSPPRHRSATNTKLQSSPEEKHDADDALETFLKIGDKSRSPSQCGYHQVSKIDFTDDQKPSCDAASVSNATFGVGMQPVQPVLDVEEKTVEVNELTAVFAKFSPSTGSESQPATSAVTDSVTLCDMVDAHVTEHSSEIDHDPKPGDVMTAETAANDVQLPGDVSNRNDGSQQDAVVAEAEKAPLNISISIVSPSSGDASSPQEGGASSVNNPPSASSAGGSDDFQPPPLPDPFQHQPPILSYDTNRTDWERVRSQRNFYCVPATLTNIAMTVVRSEKTQPDVHKRYSAILKKWIEDMAKHVNIFYLKALFLPFCIDEHYILLAVVNPAYYLECLQKRGPEKVRVFMENTKNKFGRDALEKIDFDFLIKQDQPKIQPCFLYLDSMKSLLTAARRNDALKCSLRVLSVTWTHFGYDKEWANVLWTAKGQTNIAPVRSCEPPQQVDSFNCGLFVIYFVERLMLNWFKELNVDGGNQPSASTTRGANSAITNIRALINAHLKPIDPEQRQLKFLRTLWMRRIFSIRTGCSRDHVHALTMPAVDEEIDSPWLRPAPVSKSGRDLAAQKPPSIAAAAASRNISMTNMSSGGQMEELHADSKLLSTPLDFRMARPLQLSRDTVTDAALSDGGAKKIYDPLSLAEYFLTMSYAAYLKDPGDKTVELKPPAVSSNHPLIHVASDTSDAETLVGHKKTAGARTKNRIESDNAEENAPSPVISTKNASKRIVVDADSSSSALQQPSSAHEFENVEVSDVDRRTSDGRANAAEKMRDNENSTAALDQEMDSASSGSVKTDSVAMDYADESAGLAKDRAVGESVDDGDDMDIVEN